MMALFIGLFWLAAASYTYFTQGDTTTFWSLLIIANIYIARAYT